MEWWAAELVRVRRVCPVAGRRVLGTVRGEQEHCNGGSAPRRHDDGDESSSLLPGAMRRTFSVVSHQLHDHSSPASLVSGLD